MGPGQASAEKAGEKRQGAGPCGIIRKLIPFDTLLPLAQNWYDALFPIEETSEEEK